MVDGSREVVLACSVPRCLLAPFDDTASSNLCLLPGKTMTALRGIYFGDLADARPWALGGIHFPPHRIVRAYQLTEVRVEKDSEEIEESEIADTLKDTMMSPANCIEAPKTFLEFVGRMREIRDICSAHGLVPLYHYSHSQFAPHILSEGFRMSTHVRSHRFSLFHRP